jgi:uncharacterized protein (UPF0216 family)
MPQTIEDLLTKFVPLIPKHGPRKPKAIANSLRGEILTIVFEDGRKLKFNINQKKPTFHSGEEEAEIPVSKPSKSKKEPI